MTNNLIDTCVIPAAGKGTRWAPVTGYLPKEMLPLVDRPVIEWVIQEVESSGCSNIVVVTNKQKKIIETYLSNSDLSKKVNLTFVNQNEPLGIAHAILLAKDYIGQKPFVVALPDLPTIARKPVTKQLIATFVAEDGKSHVISFDKFSSETAHLYGECLVKAHQGGLLEILHFCPKQILPKKPHHPRNIVRMSGKFIFTQEIFPTIERLIKDRKEGEISDRTALREAQNSGQKVVGVRITGHTYDTGYPEGYVRANTAFFKKFAHKKGSI
jgi:UTP--glucose-1-phosphate uridylyltransferase